MVFIEQLAVDLPSPIAAIEAPGTLVRTLALVEVLFAQAISAFIFKQPTSPREGVGMAMIVVGVVLLLWAH